MTTSGREIAALRRLASLYGVQAHFTDAQHQRVEATPQSLAAAVKGLGAPIERVADAAAALRQREDELWCWHIEPVQVAWDGVLNAIELRVPATEALADIEIEVALENGGTRPEESSHQTLWLAPERI